MGSMLLPTGTVCKYGFDETTGVLSSFRGSIEDWQAIKFNLFFNAGNIVSSVKNLALYFYQSKYTRVKSPFDVGKELGQIFWFAFYP